MTRLYELVKASSECKARAGLLKTSGGEIETPVFMPVGTLGSVKAIEQRELVELDYKIILGNTYHLYLRPGTDVVGAFSGLHNFINWSGSILTDSGGYQIFSLKDFRKVSEEGVEFKSHLDGSKHFFTPEKVVEIQRILGSDITMVLDECPPYSADRNYVAESADLSLRWAKRAKEKFDGVSSLYDRKQFLFAIGQGGVYKDLRERYIDETTGMNFDGYAIGGLSVGEPNEEMYEIADYSTERLPADKPRYLMGVGTPEDIINCVEAGVDMFDCVLPTRNARNGQLFTSRGKINVRNAKYKLSEEPIDEEVGSYASKNFTLGYLRHLFVAGEILGLQLATIQNLAFYRKLCRDARKAIIDDNFGSWKKDTLGKFRV